jgi:hypothetical protein
VRPLLYTCNCHLLGFLVCTCGTQAAKHSFMRFTFLSVQVSYDCACFFRSGRRRHHGAGSGRMRTNQQPAVIFSFMHMDMHLVHIKLQACNNVNYEKFSCSCFQTLACTCAHTCVFKYLGQFFCALLPCGHVSHSYFFKASTCLADSFTGVVQLCLHTYIDCCFIFTCLAFHDTCTMCYRLVHTCDSFECSISNNIKLQSPTHRAREVAAEVCVCVCVCVCV